MAASRRRHDFRQVQCVLVTSLPGEHREAVVLTARRGERTLHLVVITPEGHPQTITTGSQEALADFFATVWDMGADQVAGPVPVDEAKEALIVVDWVEGAGNFLVLRSALPDPADLRLLAEGALRDAVAPLSVRGPYQVPWTPVVSFVVSGRVAGCSRRMAIVTLDRSHWVADRVDTRVRPLFHNLLAAIPAATDGGIWLVEPPVPSNPWAVLPEPLGDAAPADMTPSEFGRAALTASTTYQHAGLSYHWLGPDSEGGNAVRYRRDDPEPWSVESLDRWPPDPFVVETLARTWDAHCQASSHSYLAGAVEAARQGHLDEAFRRFALHALMAHPRSGEEARGMLNRALFVGHRLDDGARPDLAEWVATTAALVAERFAEHDLRRQLLRLAAIACESLTKRAEALLHYDQALSVGAPFADPVLERDLNLDVVTTIVRLMADHEPEGLFRQELEPNAAALIRRAEAHLDRAAALVAAEARKTSRWARLAVAVYQWRLRDLTGEHQAAATGLGELLAQRALRRYSALRQSTIVFRLMALCKLAARDAAWAGPYAEALEGSETESLGGDRYCVYLVLRSDQCAEHGDPHKAFSLALAAHWVQLSADQQQIRLPRPGERHSGWLAIDTLARLHDLWIRAYLADGKTPDTTDMFRTLLGVTENAKARWFRRDLIRGLRTLPDGRLVYESIRGVNQDLDERLAWTMERPDPQDEETAGHAARRRLSTELPEHVEALPDLRALRDRLPQDSAIVAFYAARDTTYISCVTPARTVDLQLDVSLSDLTRAAFSLQAAFSGTGLHGRIDPDRPFDLDDCLYAPVRDLGWPLQNLVPLVRDAPLIMIAPHAAWHNIPVHALLLPELWETGRNPALTYVPSIGAAEDLLLRAAEHPATIASAAVVTVPGRSSEGDLFADCHHRIASVLRSSGPSVDAVIGRDATPDELLSVLAQNDLVHVLAHGWYRDNAEAMNSGLALSPAHDDDGRLAGRDLLGGRMAAGHVTFQACSLGRVVLSASDDQWGPARAALLGGADSVLAPMWDVDLRSSTELIARFYQSYLQGRMSKAQAFTQAQRDMYQASSGPDAWRHPYHWAAFKLTGV